MYLLGEILPVFKFTVKEIVFSKNSTFIDEKQDRK